MKGTDFRPPHKRTCNCTLYFLNKHDNLPDVVRWLQQWSLSGNVLELRKAASWWELSIRPADRTGWLGVRHWGRHRKVKLEPFFKLSGKSCFSSHSSKGVSAFLSEVCVCGNRRCSEGAHSCTRRACSGDGAGRFQESLGYNPWLAPPSPKVIPFLSCTQVYSVKHTYLRLKSLMRHRRKTQQLLLLFFIILKDFSPTNT